MKIISITLLLYIQEVKGEFEDYSELNDVDWSTVPISQEFEDWVPIAIVFVVFFGFRFLAKTIERS